MVVRLNFQFRSPSPLPAALWPRRLAVSGRWCMRQNLGCLSVKEIQNPLPLSAKVDLYSSSPATMTQATMVSRLNAKSTECKLIENALKDEE